MAKEEGEKSKKVKRPTALKRDMQNEKRKLVNRQYRTQMRTAMRKFQENVTKKDNAAIQASLGELYSILDRSVKKGIIKVNKASRTKSRAIARVASTSASSK